LELVNRYSLLTLTVASTQWSVATSSFWGRVYAPSRSWDNRRVFKKWTVLRYACAPLSPKFLNSLCLDLRLGIDFRQTVVVFLANKHSVLSLRKTYVLPIIGYGCNWLTYAHKLLHILRNCLSNALHSSIGQNIKSHPCPLSIIRCPVSVFRPECEKLQMAITQQRVIRYTSCLVLGW